MVRAKLINAFTEYQVTQKPDYEDAISKMRELGCKVAYPVEAPSPDTLVIEGQSGLHMVASKSAEYVDHYMETDCKLKGKSIRVRHGRSKLCSWVREQQGKDLRRHYQF